MYAGQIVRPGLGDIDAPKRSAHAFLRLRPSRGDLRFELPAPRAAGLHENDELCRVRLERRRHDPEKQEQSRSQVQLPSLNLPFAIYR
ncbi:hypothetical protein D3C72_2116780 [compost metagenome]